MAFQFPINPTVGQIFTPIAGVSYKWDGFGWVPFTASAITDAPSDGMLYGRKNGAWVAAVTDELFIGTVSMRACHSTSNHISWLELTGQIVAKATYPRLWNWLSTNAVFAPNDASWNAFNYGKFVDLGATFRVPSVIGLFPRYGNPYGQGADFGRDLGAIQIEAVGTHTHTAGTETALHTHGPGGGNIFVSITEGGDGASVQVTSGPHLVHKDISSGASDKTGTESAAHTHTINAAGGPENRPANVAYRVFIYAGNPL